MKVVCQVVLWAFVFASGRLFAQSSQQADPQTSKASLAFFGVRILKVPRAGDLPWSVDFPSTCQICILKADELTSGESSEDVFFHFLAPADLRAIEGVHVKVDPAKVRGVIVGRTDAKWAKPPNVARAPGFVAFRRDSDGITFDVPRDSPGVRVPPYDAGDVTQEYTYIETPGVQLRIEHADETRRRGPYATGSWPAAQKQATTNLEFAAREAMEMLGLDQVIEVSGVGLVTIMGFDTNYPTQSPTAAHDDDPPHWHMHMYWREAPKVRDIGHFYVGANGLLESNEWQNMPHHTDVKLAPGETQTTKTSEGEVLYTQTITAEGYFVLGTPTASCRFAPVSGGFQSGVDLHCDNGMSVRRVRAEDDVHHARLRLYINARLAEEHLYDPDTGALRSSQVSYAGR
jgi:hypothetical protein